MLADLSVRELLDRFASSDPTPGGGSAAALAGALGASLLAMVAGMSKTKTGAPEERAALDAARTELLRHRDALVALIDRDAHAYDLVVGAYRKPKGTDDEKAARTAAIQDAMKVAAETPLETMRTCADTMKIGGTVARHGNPSAASDVGVAMTLLSTGMQGGAFNVAINLDGIADAAVRKSLSESVLSLMRGIHESMSQGAEGWSDLWRGLAKNAGYPDPPSQPEQVASMATEALRHLGSAEAKDALELLARSGSEHVATRARAALERFPDSPERRG